LHGISIVYQFVEIFENILKHKQHSPCLVRVFITICSVRFEINEYVFAFSLV